MDVDYERNLSVMVYLFQCSKGRDVFAVGNDVGNATPDWLKEWYFSSLPVSSFLCGGEFQKCTVGEISCVWCTKGETVGVCMVR